MFNKSETEIEIEILDFLNYQIRGFVRKMNGSGVPVFSDDKKLCGMRPFKNEYSMAGTSDIYFLKRGQTFWIEVKSEEKMRTIARHWWKGQENFTLFISRKTSKIVNNQYNFLKGAIENGAYGGFVSRIDDVKEILENKNNDKKVYFPRRYAK